MFLYQRLNEKKRHVRFYKKNREKGFTRHCKSASFMYEKIKGMIFNFFSQILDVVLDELTEF